MPYLWSDTGIGYNEAQVRSAPGETAPVDSLALIFDPAVADRFAERVADIDRTDLDTAPLPNNGFSIQLGFVYSYLPFMILPLYGSVLVRAQLAGFDRTLEEAALDLGARSRTVLARITLPGIRPALISGGLLASTLSLDDVVIASFVTGPSATTLPIAVFSSVCLGVSPEANALATLFLVVVLVLMSAALWLIARSERRWRLHTFPPR